ncbi:NAD-dependent epimerase/dehydratase family protein [Caballeronia humi]|uniref:UDP-glucose 4-epimerase n=1 Tax=Caballeronia humi TaxID=326474 RepID=A0A158IQT5_9BURK|nr:NAD-dependent epimerase/dehydratase family protein [Caballeronia humi]SAL59072.1 UDP-glucose 4-epimerase [Caballeronia humi]
MADQIREGIAANTRSALLLGGNGFLGRHLARALTQRGVSVRIYDRGSHDDAEAGYAYFRGDFAAGERLAEALEGVDIVYHLISTTLPSTPHTHALFDVESNVCGTLRLLDQMRAAGVNRIVFTSSGGTVYGNPRTVPVPEDHQLQPLCSYGVTKVAIEGYLRLHASLGGLNAAVLRVANPYGPGKARIGVQGFIPTLFAKIAAEAPVEIWGNGSVVRDYLYVEDAVDAMLEAASWTGFRLYNVGSGVGHSLLDVVRTVERVTERAANIIYEPGRSFDVQEIYLDIGRITSETAWRPRVSLDAGCRRFWAAMK